jgi:putative hydrolase of the HAD superfamily
MIKHIIFDFGGVILNLGDDVNLETKTTGIPNDLSCIFNIPPERAKEIWKESKNSLVKGLETPKNFLQRMSSLLNKNIDINRGLDVWKRRYQLKNAYINWELIDFIKKLRKKYQIHMFTDTIDLDRGNKELVNQVEGNFQNIYRSYEQHLKKPDKEAYLNVLEKIEAKPEKCIFIDDIEANVSAARKIGIRGIIYENLFQLKSAMRKLGID